MRILIAASGSYGDVFPFIAIGRELKRRGHDVRLFASSYFAPVAAEADLPFTGIGPVEAYETTIRHPDAFHPLKGIRVIARANLEHLSELHRLMDEQISPGETLIVGSTLAFGARLFRETRGTPTATVHLAPSIFRSLEKPPRLLELGITAHLPRPIHRCLFWLVDTLVVDPIFCAGFNRFRAELGLPPIRRMFHDWLHSADLVVGLFPDWFGDPQPDWPRNLRLTGFPLYDGERSRKLPEAAAKLLESAKPTVIFTAGTAATSEPVFFAESVEACRLAGTNGILLTRYPEQIPRELPPNVHHFDYLPFSQVLSRAAAVVHHGGIGSASQALRAGVPQLVRPLAYDQFDNAHRLEILGVARILPPRRYRAGAAAETLDELTTSEAVRIACASARSKMESMDAVTSTCDVVLKELAPELKGTA